MNNLRKIFCAVLVFAILCSALAFVISADTSTASIPLRQLTDGHTPTNTKVENETNLFNDFSNFSERASYNNAIQTYIVYDEGSEDGYYMARVESDGKSITYKAGSDSHSYISMFFLDAPGSESRRRDYYHKENP